MLCSSALGGAGGFAGLDGPERGRQALDLDVDLVAVQLRVLELDVLDVDDAVELADALEELGELVEAAREGELHGHLGEELLRLLLGGAPRREVDAGDRR